MSLFSFFSKKNKPEETEAPSGVEDFISLIRIYYQASMAVNMGLNNPAFVPDMMLFKRTLRIPTQQGKLGVAERAQARKIMMKDYGLKESFFKGIDWSVKKNCKNQNHIQTYFFQFQGFSNDLLMLMTNLMQWKFRLPMFMKKMLYSMTAKTIHDVMTKSDWKDHSTRKTVTSIRKYQQTLSFSEEWMTDFVFNIIMLARQDAKNK